MAGQTHKFDPFCDCLACEAGPVVVTEPTKPTTAFTFVVTKDYDLDYRRLTERGKRVDFDPTLPYEVATFKDEAEARWYAGFKSAGGSGCLRYFVTENAEARA